MDKIVEFLSGSVAGKTATSSTWIGFLVVAAAATGVGLAAPVALPYLGILSGAYAVYCGREVARDYLSLKFGGEKGPDNPQPPASVKAVEPPVEVQP